MFALGCGVAALTVTRAGGGAPAPSFPAEARPATFTIAATGNAFGDSTTFGVAVPSGQSLVDKMRAGVSSGPAAEDFHLGGSKGDELATLYFGNGGYSGQNTTTIAAQVTGVKTNFAAEMNRFQFFSGGLNDYATNVAGYARDWPAQVKTNFATMATQAATATDYVFILAPAEAGNGPGSSVAADHAFHRRDMIAAQGRRAVDQARWLRFRRALESPTAGNADALALGLGIIPYSYRGYTSTGTYADGDPAITSQAGAPIIGSAGTDGALIWDTTGSKMYRCGSEGWQLCETKHQGVLGNTKLALLYRDMQAASEGSGPPFVPPAEMRCAADAADGAALGQLVFTGTATAFALADYAGTPSTDFAVSATGAVTRLGAAPLTEGLAQLMVAATNANGTLYSPLDLYVTRASTVTAPAMRTIAAPGLSLGARQAFGAADTGVAALSFALWINPDAWNKTLFHTGKSGTTNPLVLSLLTNGKLRMTTRNGAGTQAIISGAAVLATGAAKWVFGKITPLAAQLYINDTADTLTGTFQGTGSFDFVTGTIITAPFWLASATANQLLEPAGAFTGGCGFLAFWDADIDWSVQATRRQLMNADFTPLAGRTPYSAVGGTAPRMEMWGGLGDWLYGTPDGSNGPQTMSLDYRAIARMT